MAKIYDLTKEYQKVEETTGTIQNLGISNVEVSDSPDVPGIILPPLKAISYENSKMYIRACGPEYARVVVVDFIAAGGSGISSAALQSIQQEVDAIKSKSIIGTASGIDFILNEDNSMSVGIKEGDNENGK